MADRSDRSEVLTSFIEYAQRRRRVRMEVAFLRGLGDKMGGKPRVAVGTVLNKAERGQALFVESSNEHLADALSYGIGGMMGMGNKDMRYARPTGASIDQQLKNERKRADKAENQLAHVKSQLQRTRDQNPLHVMGYLIGWGVDSEPNPHFNTVSQDHVPIEPGEKACIISAQFAVPIKHAEVATNMFRGATSQQKEFDPLTYSASLEETKEKYRVESLEWQGRCERARAGAAELRAGLEEVIKTIGRFIHINLNSHAEASYELRHGTTGEAIALDLLEIANLASKALEEKSDEDMGRDFLERLKRVRAALEEKKVDVAADLILKIDEDEEKRRW